MTDALNQSLRHVPAWPLYLLAPLPVIWLFWQGATGGLGVEPIEVIEHKLGLWALWALIAGLCVTPLRTYTGIRLIKYRRAIGLIAFFYVFMHLAVWLVLDVQILSEVWADILKRPYITVGMVAFVLMVPLTLTSNNWSVRKLGAVGWQRLHRLTYAVVLLGALHFLMLTKGFQLEPLIYTAIVVALVVLRTLPKRSASVMRSRPGRPAGAPRATR
ncbi:MAG: protein-methionine-sulfoxide reductase heme-binding subunit MsrQ [Pseudomonadota bacterium]